MIPAGSSQEVVEGYKKIYETISDKFFKSDVPVVEFLMSVISPGTVAMQAALQHPLRCGNLL
jgi:choline dehydrogenase